MLRAPSKSSEAAVSLVQQEFMTVMKLCPEKEAMIELIYQIDSKFSWEYDIYWLPYLQRGPNRHEID